MAANVTDKTIGANVRRFRQALEISQAHLAEILSERGFPFSQQTMQKVEKGDRPLKLSEAVEVAQALGIDLRDLHEADEDKSTAAAKLRRMRGLCDEIRTIARAALIRLDKLQQLQRTLHRTLEEREYGIPAILNDPEITWFHEASITDLLAAVQEDRSREPLDVRLADLGMPSPVDIAELVADAHREIERNG